MMGRLKAWLIGYTQLRELLNQLDVVAGPYADEGLRAGIECVKNALQPDEVQEATNLYRLAAAYDLTPADIRAAGVAKGSV